MLAAGEPTLPPGTLPWVVGGLLCLWLTLRLALLRRRQREARAAGEPAPRSVAWLEALAARAYAGPLLLLGLLACAALALHAALRAR